MDSNKVKQYFDVILLEVSVDRLDCQVYRKILQIWYKSYKMTSYPDMVLWEVVDQ